jgi:hypothetical protein
MIAPAAACAFSGSCLSRCSPGTSSWIVKGPLE